MTFKPVGADENGKFPSRVETWISQKAADDLNNLAKPVRIAADKIYAPKATNGYAPLGSDGKVPAANLPTATPTTRTAFVNLPPFWEKVTTSTNTAAFRGTWFACMMSGTVSRMRAKLNTANGVTYTLGVYEINPSDGVTVTAVVGKATYTESAAAGGKTVDVAINAPIVAGKYYVLGVYSSSNVLDIYYSNAGGQFSSAVSMTRWEGSIDPQRNFGSLPVVGSALGKSSDYVTVGMSVDI